MENIWSFLLQTLSVSLIGLLLLVVKLLLRNRLSPRWQYAVWATSNLLPKPVESLF